MDLINLDAHPDAVIADEGNNVIIVTYPGEVKRGELLQYKKTMYEVMAPERIGKHWRLRVRKLGSLKG